MEDKPKRIVIKKVKKHGEGHHGGSWKVAYADFVTAMMAFFLMLWLLSMVSTEKRAVLAAYFKDFSLFEKGGKSFMMDGGIKPTIQHQTGSDVVDITNESGTAMNEEIAAKILASLESRGDYPKNQVLVEMSPDGIRIQIVDSKENPIFPPGSAQLTDAGKKSSNLSLQFSGISGTKSLWRGTLTDPRPETIRSPIGSSRRQGLLLRGGSWRTTVSTRGESHVL